MRAKPAALTSSSTRSEDFAAAVERLTDGRGVDVVYDGVGQATFARSLEALAPRGHLVSFGQASGPVGSWDIGAFAAEVADDFAAEFRPLHHRPGRTPGHGRTGFSMLSDAESSARSIEASRSQTLRRRIGIWNRAPTRERWS